MHSLSKSRFYLAYALQDERFELLTGDTDLTLFPGIKLVVRVQKLEYDNERDDYKGVAVRLENDVPGFIPVCSCLGALSRALNVASPVFLQEMARLSFLFFARIND